MHDFCYLVSPYYPPDDMIKRIKEKSDDLIRSYPSGLDENVRLAAEMFSVNPQNIVVGNGASELINILMSSCIKGNLGIIRPTFEEYANRYKYGEVVEFIPENTNFSYTSNDVISFFQSKKIETLVVINPDNPSGNYMFKSDVLSLAKWCEERGIKLIYDESFIDFSEEEASTLIDTEHLEKYGALCVIKSISKSYGIPGLRLGVLATGDTDMIKLMMKELSIWNINSFAEFFMQIEGEFRSDYLHSMHIFKEERKRFVSELGRIPNVRAIPTQSNFCMVELMNGVSAIGVSEKLLRRDILVRSLTDKISTGQYMRVAIHNRAENDVFMEALREVLGIGE